MNPKPLDPNRKPWTPKRGDKTAAKRIRDRVRKNRTDPALHVWAERGAERVPDDSPCLWLVDNNYLMSELARIRELVQRVPLISISMSLPLQSVADAVWNLEQQLRDILNIQRERQREFARKAENVQKRSQNQTRKQETKIIRMA